MQLLTVRDSLLTTETKLLGHASLSASTHPHTGAVENDSPTGRAPVHQLLVPKKQIFVLNLPDLLVGKGVWDHIAVRWLQYTDCITVRNTI